MKKRFLFSAATATALGACLFAAAQPGLQRFKKFDRDGDGRLSRDEAPLPALFDRLDKDQDGFITPAEALQAVALSKLSSEPATEDGLPLDKVFTWLDKNRDGQLDTEELSKPEHRAKLDTDRDGFITLAEARAVIGDLVPRSLLGNRFPDAEAAPAIEEADLKEQPQILKAADHGIGRRLPDLPLQDMQGQSLALEPRTTVLALLSPVCPISRKLGPELARLEKDCASSGTAFVLVNLLPSADETDIAAFKSDHSLTAPVINDTSTALQRALAATSTTEVFVLDAARTLVYRGAINDQYGLGYAKDAPTRHYLRDALADLAAGRSVRIAATTAPGCALDLPPSEPTVATSSVTYHNEIARIMQANCVECHHQGGLAPFSLETMQDLIDHAGMIKKQVTRGAMPPWFAAAPAAGHDSPWANDRALSARDQADLLAWLEGDRAPGDPATAPLPRQFEDEWTIGKPDHIVQLPRPVPIKAEGVMPYQFVVAETTLTEDKWVRGYEILPTDRSVVHHVIVQVHEKGKGKILDREEGLDGYWAAYVPGNGSKVYPTGFARKLPAGARVSFQIHYTPNGRATEDQLRMGLLFAPEPPRYVVRTLAMAQRKLDIPPGTTNHVHTFSRTLPADVTVMAFMAHMHVRGKSFRFDLKTPEGTHESLLDIPRYDFNWQLRYDLKQPRTLPSGSTVTITAAFDNSTGNPANPDPTQRVRWGPQTYDEMMIGYFETFSPLSPRDVAAR